MLQLVTKFRKKKKPITLWIACIVKSTQHGNCEEQLPSTDSRPTAGQQSADSWPTLNRQATDRSPTGNQQVSDNLVKTKSEAIKTLQTKLADAKKTIAELKAELKTLRQRTADEPQQQQILKENNCSMANTFRLADCPCSTLRDFIAIAELRIVDEREFESASREISVGSVKDLETVCRRRLRRHLPAKANMRREGQLLPLKFDDRFYD